MFYVLAENKQEMLDTNINLPQSTISLVGFFSTRVCCLLVSRLGLAWTQEGLPAKKTLTLKLAKGFSESQIS